MKNYVAVAVAVVIISMMGGGGADAQTMQPTVINPNLGNTSNTNDLNNLVIKQAPITIPTTNENMNIKRSNIGQPKKATIGSGPRNPVQAVQDLSRPPAPASTYKGVGALFSNSNTMDGSSGRSGDGKRKPSDKVSCGVCLFSDANFYGNYLCVRLLGLSVRINKLPFKIKSVSVINDSCRAGVLSVQLFNKVKNKGISEISKSDRRNLGSFANKPKSAKLVLTNTRTLGANACEACLHSEINYKGNSVCFYGAQNSTKLKLFRLNNSAKSISFRLDKCKTQGGAVFYENNMSGQKLSAYKNIPDLRGVKRGSRGNWSKQISSLNFTRDMRKAYRAESVNRVSQAAATSAKKCQVCLYEHVNYRGRKYCSGPNSVPALKAVNLRNEVSSIKFVGNNCQRAKLHLYEDPKYKSYKLVVNRNVPHLGKVRLTTNRKLSKRNQWNDVADSFKFVN
ncbi:MAG: hypothetical protein COB59_01350 [Rhodospirillaceae bacterium]|nr:MAG: hypothetical protein COB59_01350 [Rhodospirillaceae bacterium]